MMYNQFIINKFSFLGESFLSEIHQFGVISKIKAKTELLREGEKIKYVPFLITGSVKVYCLNDGRELIYYYSKPGESCVMSFASIFDTCISKTYVIAEEDSEILQIPVSIMDKWLVKYPEINKLFYQEYDKRFSDIMHMVNEAVFHRLDKRVLNYIKQQILITGNNPIKLTHKEIANNLGTSREVVSRVLKKIENENEIFQTKEGIGIIDIISRV